jgi:pimeloyl-ACP methyl ester carboxylesterase
VKIPALVLAGSEDRFMPTRHALGLARSLPHAELRFIPRAGHLAYLEEPESFADAVFEFLERRCGKPTQKSVDVPLTGEAQVDVRTL